MRDILIWDKRNKVLLDSLSRAPTREKYQRIDIENPGVVCIRC